MRDVCVECVRGERVEGECVECVRGTQSVWCV